MPTLSKHDASIVEDFGVAEDRHDDLDGYTVNFLTIRQDQDLAPMLSALPEGNCPCPHWRYVFKGRLTIRSRRVTRPPRGGLFWRLVPQKEKM